jgi:hypothetical protein
LPQILQYSHWPSYNVPFFEETYEKAGYRQAAARLAALGPEYAQAALGLSYQLAPRAQLFRRDAAQVADLQGLKKLLRWGGGGVLYSVNKFNLHDNVCAFQ